MFAPISPRQNESRECIEAEGERAEDDIEVRRNQKKPTKRKKGA